MIGSDNDKEANKKVPRGTESIFRIIVLRGTSISRLCVGWSDTQIVIC